MTNLPKMAQYVSQETGVAILVPQGWRVQVVNPAKFQIFGPPESAYKDYRSSMSFMRGKPPNITDEEEFEHFIARTEKKMLIDYNRFALLNEERYKLGGETSSFSRYFEWHDEGTGFDFTQLQAFVLVNSDTMYLINAATLKPLKKKYLLIFELILKAMKILS